jgi:penicillin-binding protein 1A
MELTASYATIANGGVRTKPHFIVSVITSDGEVLEERKPEYFDAVRPESAFVLTKMLEGAVERGTGKVARALNRPVAAKTGTTSENRDAWFIGYTPDLATGVWVGFDDNRPLGRNETGGHTAGPFFTEFMIQALAQRPALDFTPPKKVTAVTIDRESGQLATSICADTITEYFVQGTEPMEYCKRERKDDIRL